MKTSWHLWAFVALLVGCGSGESEEGSARPVDASDTEGIGGGDGEQDTSASQIEKVGPVHMIPVEVREFNKLPLSAKKRVYHHRLAALEGDVVYTHQLGPMNGVIKRVLDGIGEAGNRVPEQLRRKIEPYSKLFMIHHGNTDPATGEKILPTFIPGELAAATQIAINAGIDLGLDDFRGAELGANQLEQLEAFLAALRPWIFEGDVVPTESRTNLLNPFRVAPTETDDQANEKTKQGDRLSHTLSNLTGHLRDGMSDMKPDEKAAMENLIGFLQTGDEARYAGYLELWAKTDSEVEVVVGFLNPYLDPRGREGGFGAAVMIRDGGLSELMYKAAGLASHYRQQMPWGRRFKKGAVERPVPRAYDLVIVAGNGGPLTHPPMYIPLDLKTVKKYGQKRFYFTNLADARDKVITNKTIPEFSWSQEVADRRARWHRVARNDFLVLHEVIGRGMLRSGLEGIFGDYAKPLEEMFCALTALYLVFDIKNQEIGLVPTEESAMAIYDSYASGMLEQLAHVGDATTLIEPEMRARQAIVSLAVAKGAVEVVSGEGHFFVRVNDYQAMRAAIKEGLLKVHGIVISGDASKAKRLITDLGTAFPAEWRDDVQTRFAELGLPGVIAFSYPTLVPRLDSQGKIVDVVLE